MVLLIIFALAHFKTGSNFVIIFGMFSFLLIFIFIYSDAELKAVSILLYSKLSC